jgi:hypothetical protein
MVSVCPDQIRLFSAQNSVANSRAECNSLPQFDFLLSQFFLFHYSLGMPDNPINSCSLHCLSKYIWNWMPWKLYCSSNDREWNRNATFFGVLIIRVKYLKSGLRDHFRNMGDSSWNGFIEIGYLILCQIIREMIDIVPMKDVCENKQLKSEVHDRSPIRLIRPVLIRWIGGMYLVTIIRRLTDVFCEAIILSVSDWKSYASIVPDGRSWSLLKRAWVRFGSTLNIASDGNCPVNYRFKLLLWILWKVKKSRLKSWTRRINKPNE